MSEVKADDVAKYEKNLQKSAQNALELLKSLRSSEIYLLDAEQRISQHQAEIQQILEDQIEFTKKIDDETEMNQLFDEVNEIQIKILNMIPKSPNLNPQGEVDRDNYEELAKELADDFQNLTVDLQKSIDEANQVIPQATKLAQIENLTEKLKAYHQDHQAKLQKLGSAQ